MTSPSTAPGQGHHKGSPDLSRAVWRRSSEATPDESSVEVAFVDDLIALRDSKHPDGDVLLFTKAEWEAFVEGAKDGEFELP